VSTLRLSFASLALIALLGGCAVQAEPNGLGGAPGATAGAHGQQQGKAVVAESHFGHGSVSGPVRPTGRGHEVRMPGGTWIDCGRSCSDTLRRQTVDFWENHGGPNSVGDGAGYLSWQRSW
jgi:hypothetical protein